MVLLLLLLGVVVVVTCVALVTRLVVGVAGVAVERPSEQRGPNATAVAAGHCIAPLVLE